MRARVLLVALLLLVLGGSASAAQPKATYVHVVRHIGSFTATLTYTERPKDWLSPISNVRVRIERDGQLLLKRKLCQPHLRAPYRCNSWGEPAELTVHRLGPSDRPAFVVDLWTGGNTCCQATYIAIAGPKIAWISHTFSFLGAGITRIRHQSVFIGADGRFYCAFSVCAGGSTPIQIWKIDSGDRFVDVTRHYPRRIRAQARRLATGGGPHQAIRDQGSGVIAAWCGDEYLLGHEARCSRVLAYAAKHHRRRMQGALVTRGLIRGLMRDLVRWGYKR